MKFKKFHSVAVKAVNEQEFTVDAVVSTKAVDRDGDIILPESFKKRLKHYKEHPVLMADHNYGIMKQIGEAVKVAATDEGLEVRFKYYVGAGNAEADWAFFLAQKGVAAYSIGFMAHAWEWISEKDKESGAERYTGRKFTEIELLEISQVAVPCNREALQQEMAHSDTVKELATAVMKGIDDGSIQPPEPTKPEPTKPADGPRKDLQDKPHTDDPVQGDGPAKAQAAEHLPTWDNITAAVKNANKEALQP